MKLSTFAKKYQASILSRFYTVNDKQFFYAGKDFKTITIDSLIRKMMSMQTNKALNLTNDGVFKDTLELLKDKDIFNLAAKTFKIEKDVLTKFTQCNRKDVKTLLVAFGTAYLLTR